LWAATFPIGSLSTGVVNSNLVAGGMSGITAYSLVYPMDLVKTLLSLNIIPPGNSFARSIMFVYRKYGFRALYQGLSATIYVELQGVYALFGGEIRELRALEKPPLPV
jgi:hypothetical protein